ncbi:hypothetical protein PGT21_035799 [Puccinia graminis f. sp. tritici]|uniref:Uncharacterized protein n=1 Tax=Puccinia graminis f. sp. tritici TaxID=56615 RepID=A0A5B0P361_PUCGR|nr:hypothetical protein PGT21_035799 [Puccinia graminis f. sp. tritici]
MSTLLRNGSHNSLKQQQSELEYRKQSCREQPQRETEQEEQFQREIQPPPDSRAGVRLVGLQQGDDEQYQFSPAATERLRKLKQLSRQNQYKAKSGRSVTNGAGSLTSSSAFNTPSVRHNLPGFRPITIANLAKSTETPYSSELAPKQLQSITTNNKTAHRKNYVNKFPLQF